LRIQTRNIPWGQPHESRSILFGATVCVLVVHYRIVGVSRQINPQSSNIIFICLEEQSLRIKNPPTFDELRKNIGGAIEAIEVASLQRSVPENDNTLTNMY